MQNLKGQLLGLSIVLVFWLAVPTNSAQIPQKLFDVRNGNSLTLDAVTYPRATIIVYRDNPAKNDIIDTIADGRGYQAAIPDPNKPGQTIPNPVSRQQEFNKFLQQIIRDAYRSYKGKNASESAKIAAEMAADAELPDRN